MHHNGHCVYLFHFSTDVISESSRVTVYLQSIQGEHYEWRCWWSNVFGGGVS